MDNYQTVAIIPAAGTGQRMNAGVNKIWLPLVGRSILEHILRVFQDCHAIAHTVVVVNSSEKQKIGDFIYQSEVIDAAKFTIIIGGSERQHSIARGLDFFESWAGWHTERKIVLVHDAARALVTPEIINNSIEQCLIFNAVGVAVPVKDTIKQIDADGFVRLTHDRSILRAVQTPQVFDFKILNNCYQQVSKLNRTFTDDCSIVEYCEYPVKLIEGSYENLKITTPEDLVVAETILRRRAQESANRTGL
jgi:2-C-methyl-D-erythritol 4-phosphate cytidylyltransferase